MMVNGDEREVYGNSADRTQSLARPAGRLVSALVLAAALGAPAWALDGRVLLPRPELTPGEALPGCTIADLQRPGYSHSVRPAPGFTRHVKHDQMVSGYQGRGLRYACVEEDHLIPIGWCGNPNSERNLWPQLRAACGAPDGQSAEDKDACEYQGFALLRGGHLDLAEAQKGVAHDWVAYCRDVVAPLAEKWHIHDHKSHRGAD